MKIFRVATLGTSLNTFCEGILKDLKNGVLGEPTEVIALASPDTDLDAIAEREGVRTIGVPMERHISLWKDLISLFQLITVFRTEKPNIVHSMTPKAGLLCMMAAWLVRIPVRVHTFTGLVWPTASGLSRKILMTTDWITCACATHVIPEGQGVLNDLKNYGITKKPLKVLGYGNVMGVNLAKYSRRENVLTLAQIIQTPSIFTFVFVGRIVGDKGINELVTEFARLRERSKLHSRLVLVGRYEDNLDPVSAETRQLIDSLPEIEAVGPKYGDDLLAYYAAADCFVFPSYREGFPNTVLEAGAMELASIVTDINGCRDIVTLSSEDGKETAIEDVLALSQPLADGEKMSIRENGIMIPSKDADALYDAMVWMLEHEEERKAMGKRARQIVAERYEQGFVREKLYEFYREVLGS